MKIDIGCAVDGCEAVAFAEIACNAFDEPATGLYLPEDWGAVASSSVDFYCPRHNPALTKPGVMVEAFCQSCGSPAPKGGPCPKCSIAPDADALVADYRPADVTVEEKDQTTIELPDGVTEPEDLARCTVRIAQGEAVVLPDGSEITTEDLKELRRSLPAIRATCKQRKPITAGEAALLEHALTLVENERNTHKRHRIYYQGLVRQIRSFMDAANGPGSKKPDTDADDVEFVMVSVVDDPPDPLCRIKTEAAIEPVTDPEKKVDLNGHQHDPAAGPTGPARYCGDEHTHTLYGGEGQTGWAKETPGHVHRARVPKDNETGPPIPREAREESLTKEEFEQGYAERSGMSVEELRGHGFVVRPCECGEPGCKGWQIDHKVRLDFFEAHGMEPPP